MTKKFKSNMFGAITIPMVVLGIIALVVIAILAGYISPGPITTPEPASIVAGAKSGDITLTLTNLTGTGLGTDSTVTVYLTSPGVYATVYDGWAAIDEEGGLVSPYDPNKMAAAKTGTPSSNEVTFSIVGKKYDATNPSTYPGTDFGLFIKDAGTTPGDYNAEIGKIKVNARDNLDETTIVTVEEGLDGYMGSDISLSPIGNISFYDPQSGSYDRGSYVLDTAANASVTDQDFTLEVRLNSDNTAARDVGIYVEELDSVQGTATLTLDDVEVWVNGKKLSGVSLTKVADLDSGSAEKKNAPSANTSGTSTMWYVEGGEFTISRTNVNNLDAVLIKMVDFDYDVSAANTYDKCDIKFHLVKNNGHKDSDSTGETFTYTIDEDGTTGYVAE